MIQQSAQAKDRRSTPAAVTSTEPWLLLVYQLPARPVSARVKAWRRLQELGAVAVKNSVYALPNRAETREDFEWVRAEIVATGGQATVFQASTIDTVSSDDLRETFRRDRQQDYRALVQGLDKLARAAGGRRRRHPRTLAKELRACRERLAAIESLDYFGARGREEARTALARLEALAARGELPARGKDAALDPAAFHHRRWLTRPRPGIDRMASAWLIRRFIDPHAVFAFAEPDAARKPGTLTFDLFEGDFTHDGDRCTFEVLRARFGLGERRLDDLAELVHDLDLKDGRFGRAEAPVLGALVEGLRQLHVRDEALLEHGITLFEALYRGREVLVPTRPARRPRAEAPADRKTRAKIGRSRGT
jgi:hypothetical protein